MTTFATFRHAYFSISCTALNFAQNVKKSVDLYTYTVKPHLKTTSKLHPPHD